MSKSVRERECESAGTPLPLLPHGHTPALPRGFTLIEILVSITLMIILLSAITIIFMKTTETVAGAEARTVVYDQAKYALDIMEGDLLGCLSFNRGQQRFCMENGRANGPGEMPTYGAPGNHVGNAADRLLFRATTAVGNTMQTAEVTYELIPGSKAIGKDGSSLKDGDPDRAATLRNSPPRPLFTLVRRTRVPGRDNAEIYGEMPVDAAGEMVPDSEIAFFVTSFNLEYLANTMSFSQLEPSYFTQEELGRERTGWDPLGNGEGPNDGENGATPYRVPCIRVTLMIVDDVGERSERAIVKEIWLPMG